MNADSETGTAIGTGDNIVEQLRRRGAESHHRQADDMIRYIESPRDRRCSYSRSAGMRSWLLRAYYEGLTEKVEIKLHGAATGDDRK